MLFMKKILFLSAFVFLLFSGFSQHNLSQESYAVGETVPGLYDDFAYQYNRIISLDPNNPGKLLITFVFINGKSHNAISYRQEVTNATTQWLESDMGSFKKEGFVDVYTALVPPEHVVSWKCSYTPKTKSKNGVVEVDKSALLIMNDNFEVDKKVFKKERFLLK